MYCCDGITSQDFRS
uniref:Uncharacterized protein n=1 Tax=Rhizophora mucronata TaxID=61149 RepID=A0A2P2J2X1_RHIMU